MLLTRHNGFKIYKIGDRNDGVRDEDIYQVSLPKEAIPSTLILQVRTTYKNHPSSSLAGEETEYYLITLEGKKVGLRFDDLEMAKVYFDILDAKTPWAMSLNTIEYMQQNYSSWFI